MRGRVSQQTLSPPVKLYNVLKRPIFVSALSLLPILLPTLGQICPLRTSGTIRWTSRVCASAMGFIWCGNLPANPRAQRASASWSAGGMLATGRARGNPCRGTQSVHLPMMSPLTSATVWMVSDGTGMNGSERYPHHPFRVPPSPLIKRGPRSCPWMRFGTAHADRRVRVGRPPPNVDHALRLSRGASAVNNRNHSRIAGLFRDIMKVAIQQEQPVNDATKASVPVFVLGKVF